MAKKIFYGADARDRVLKGSETLYEAVKTTLGPKGRNVVIGRSFGTPLVTKDGVTVAKNIELEDVDDETLGYKVGAELIKQASSKLNDVAGDGTTTVAVLTHHILKEANKLIAAGHNPILLKKGIDQAADEALAGLEGLSENIENNQKRVVEVATISASDSEIGKLIADVIKKVGKDSVVTVEASQGLELESEVVKGFEIDRGFVSPYMATDQTRLEAVYDSPAIVITDKKVSNIQEFVPLIEKIAQSGKKDLLLIAEDVDGDALPTLILNKLKGSFNTVAIKAPSFGDRRKEILEDIAILTGATVISSELNQGFDTVTLDDVGSARKVIVTKDNTTIIEGNGDKTEIAERVESIAKQIDSSTSEYDKENLQKRRASIEGKVAVIKVGGATETEIDEKKFRVDDAVAAVKVALQEGIVPGGGVTLINLARNIKLTEKDSSILAGKQLLVDALEKPFKILLRNSGINADEWLPQVKAKISEGSYGIDVAAKESVLTDLKEAGVIDPTRVTKEVIQNSVSVAGTAMTMGALVVDIPTKEAQQDAPPMGMM